MPTVRRIGAYRFFFYSMENDEPPHIHVERDDLVTKFWLDPISQAKGSRFPKRELTRLLQYVVDHRDEFVEAWHGYFGN